MRTFSYALRGLAHWCCSKFLAGETSTELSQWKKNQDLKIWKTIKIIAWKLVSEIFCFQSPIDMRNFVNRFQITVMLKCKNQLLFNSTSLQKYQGLLQDSMTDSNREQTVPLKKAFQLNHSEEDGQQKGSMRTSKINSAVLSENFIYVQISVICRSSNQRSWENLTFMETKTKEWQRRFLQTNFKFSIIDQSSGISMS